MIDIGYLDNLLEKKVDNVVSGNKIGFVLEEITFNIVNKIFLNLKWEEIY